MVCVMYIKLSAVLRISFADDYYPMAH